MTNVTFRVDTVADGQLVTLDETSLHHADPAQTAPLADEMVGAIVITTGDDELAVADDLTAVTLNLCFLGPAAVLEDPHGHFLYRTTLATRHLVMIPLGHDVRLFGEGTPVVTLDRAALLPALYRCGLRVVEVLERVGDPAEAAVTADDLRTAATTTAATLERHGLQSG